MICRGVLNSLGRLKGLEAGHRFISALKFLLSLLGASQSFPRAALGVIAEDAPGAEQGSKRREVFPQLPVEKVGDGSSQSPEDQHPMCRAAFIDHRRPPWPKSVTPSCGVAPLSGTVPASWLTTECAGAARDQCWVDALACSDSKALRVHQMKAICHSAKQESASSPASHPQWGQVERLL